MSKGFVMFSRDILEDQMYFSERFTRMQAFQDLCYLAAFKEREFNIRGNKISIQKGQVSKSVRDLAQRWKWSVNTVTSYLKELKNNGYIDTQKTSINQIITIKKYLLVNTQINTQIETQIETQTDTQIETPIINIEKLKKEIKKEIEEELTIVSEKKKKANPVRKSLGGKAQDLFVAFYKENGFSDTDYYWTPKDGSNMKQLLSKIRTARESKNMPCDDDSMLTGLKALLSSITDRWILAHFDISTINSKYNEIVACARNGGSNGNMEVGRIMQYDKSKFEGVTSDNFFKG